MTAPRTAMLLAAGLGTRMRPLTEHTPKPLLRLAGRTLLDHALDRLADAGVETVVVNAHWHADQVAAHLAARTDAPRTVLRHEPELLETGGAVLAALDLLGDGPFFVVNGDTVWLDGPTPALARLAAAWDPARSDAVLLAHRSFHVQGETGPGDFAMDPWGKLRRRREREIVPYIFAGVQVARATAFADALPGRFSMNTLWDRAIDAERLHGVVHDGLWFHLSTPADLADAEHNLRARALGDAR